MKTFPSEAQRRQTSRGRFYELPDGSLLPSVTTILGVIAKPALVHWAAKVERELVTSVAADLFEEVRRMAIPPKSRVSYLTLLENKIGNAKAAHRHLEKAAQIGSQAHAMIEWTLRKELGERVGKCPEMNQKAASAFAAWEKWRASVNLKPRLIEQTVWSRTHGYAGTLDLDAEVNGVETVIDWKTGKRVYVEAFLQNAAYRYALQEMKHGVPAAGLIVRLPKGENDPNFEVRPVPDALVCFEMFLHALRMWQWQQEMEERRKAA